jgi:hypothetical protein
MIYSTKASFITTYFFIIHSIFLPSTVSAQSLSILHLSFHTGCLHEIENIAQELDFKVTSLFIPRLAAYEFDGYASGNALYNIGPERALSIWNKHKDYFNQFDAIITSDTAPLSRIFLQNNYEKPLIIWVCNRFDYADTGSLDCEFPDKKYYELLQQAHDKENVFIVPYTAFESFYAEQKNVMFNHDVIQPSGIFLKADVPSSIPSHIDKSATFFIPPYLNDTTAQIEEHCALLHIPTYKGRYNGPNDLSDFKGIIHTPYSWSNLALFENIQNELPYFIPSFDFMVKMYDAGIIWWPNGNFFKNNHQLAEWYNAENSEIITYFDSWEDLKNKIEATDFDALRVKIKQFAQTHRKTVLKKWNDIITTIIDK